MAKLRALAHAVLLFWLVVSWVLCAQVVDATLTEDFLVVGILRWELSGTSVMVRERGACLQCFYFSMCLIHLDLGSQLLLHRSCAGSGQ